MSKRREARDFPAEYLAIWQLAVEGKLMLHFPSRGAATNRKVDLQRFRKRLAEEAPLEAESFFQVDLLVEGDAAAGLLTAYVPEWKRQVREALAKSDLTSEAIVEIATEVLEQKREEVQDQVAETLSDLGFKAPS